MIMVMVMLVIILFVYFFVLIYQLLAEAATIILDKIIAMSDKLLNFLVLNRII